MADFASFSIRFFYYAGQVIGMIGFLALLGLAIYGAAVAWIAAMNRWRDIFNAERTFDDFKEYVAHREEFNSWRKEQRRK